MTEQKIINELDSIVAFADELKVRATELRRKIAAPVRRRTSVLSEQEKVNLVSSFRNSLIKKATASTMAGN